MKQSTREQLKISCPFCPCKERTEVQQPATGTAFKYACGCHVVINSVLFLNGAKPSKVEIVCCCGGLQPFEAIQKLIKGYNELFLNSFKVKKEADNLFKMSEVAMQKTLDQNSRLIDQIAKLEGIINDGK